MSQVDLVYKTLCEHILHKGEFRNDRTGVGTKAIFGYSFNLDISSEFPLLTLKKVAHRQMVDELLWFISGSTNVNDLPPRTQKWWRPWAAPSGKLGPIYGHQLVSKQRGSQLQTVVASLRSDPNSRRHVISLWNSIDVPNQKLPCCHGTVIQYHVSGDTLSVATYQRSADVFLGLPINIASYSLLTHLIAATLNLRVGSLHYTLGDAHIYSNHIVQVEDMLCREPLDAATVSIIPKSDICEYTEDDILISYSKFHPAIKGDIAY